MDLTQEQLARKLLVMHHLNVPEREALPAGGVRLSVLVAAVQRDLSLTGWFPLRLAPGHDIGVGAVIEARGDEVWVHEQHEVGVARYSPIRSYRVAGVPEAIRSYVAAMGGDPIDGVEIDWTS